MNINKHLLNKHFSSGRQGTPVRALVIHYTAGMLDDLWGIWQNREASAHYGIARNGQITQYVEEGDTAWAVGNWAGNLETISIEMVGDDANGYTNEQFASLYELSKDILNRYGLPMDRAHIRQHNEFAATSCPGNILKGAWDDIIRGIGGANVSAPSVTKPSGKSVEQLAQEVIAGFYGNAGERKRALGLMYDEVQARVNQILSGDITAPQNDLNTMADAVINGTYGNGEARKRALGANYDAVMNIVNARLLGHQAPQGSNGSNIDDLVQRTLRGDFGNGDDRKRALGSNYDTVMAVINGSSAPQGVDLNDLVMRTERGDFGNGEDRKQALGSNYDAVMAIINSK